MKLAYSVATPDAPGPLMSFYGDFKQNVADIKAIGYDALELFVRDPADMDVGAVGRIIEQSGLAVAAVGTNPAMTQDGLTLLSSDAEIRQRAVQRVLDAVDFAAPYGAPICIGKYRGTLWKDDRDAAMRELAGAFRRICEYADKKGVGIMLEPQNRWNIDNLNTTAEAADWIDTLGCANLGILYDTYHGDLTEVSVAAGIVAARGKIGFVHCSDSDRLPPGTGHIHLADAFAVLKAIGFDGYVSMEIAQKPNSQAAAATAFATVSYILQHVV